MAVLLASVGVAVAFAAWLLRDVLVDHGQVLRALAHRDDLPTVPVASFSQDDVPPPA